MERLAVVKTPDLYNAKDFGIALNDRAPNDVSRLSISRGNNTSIAGNSPGVSESASASLSAAAAPD